MPTIKEVKMQLRHKECAEQITECQGSGMSVKEWFQAEGLSCNTYYCYLRILRMELLGQADLPIQKDCRYPPKEFTR